MSVMKEAETVEVSMLEPEVVVAIRQLKATGLGERGIARVLGINRKTVRRWLEGPITRVQERPQRRKLDAATPSANNRGNLRLPEITDGA